jgi:hypothetical protein
MCRNITPPTLNIERECAAKSGLGRKPNGSTMHLGKPFRDEEAKARATVIDMRAWRSLGEAGEE